MMRGLSAPTLEDTTGRCVWDWELAADDMPKWSCMGIVSKRPGIGYPLHTKVAERTAVGGVLETLIRPGAALLHNFAARC